jgi:hypothetical protein
MNFENQTMYLISQMAWLTAGLAILSGLVLLHIRLRNVPTTSLLISAVAFGTWDFFGSAIIDFFAPNLDPVTNNGVGNNAAEVLDAMSAYEFAHGINVMCESVLIVWVALSFLLVALSVRTRHTS